MNAQKQLQKYERLAEIAHKLGCYKCARKWSIKAEKLEAVIVALEKIEKEIKSMEPIKVYEGIFGQLQLDDKHVDLASTQALVSRDGVKFLKQNFNPGDLIETRNGIQMIDKNFNCMKAGFHVINPDKAKQLAGIA